MPEKPWKRAKREIADLVGGHQVLWASYEAPDVASDTLVLNVKLRLQLPRWIVEEVEKARHLTPGYKLGGMVMMQGSTGDKYLVLRLSDYLAWHVGGKREGP